MASFYTEYEKFGLRVSKKKLEEMLSKQRNSNTCDIDGGEYASVVDVPIQAKITFSFLINTDEDVTIEDDKATAYIECKGTIEIENDLLRAIFLKEVEK